MYILYVQYTKTAKRGCKPGGDRLVANEEYGGYAASTRVNLLCPWINCASNLIMLYPYGVRYRGQPLSVFETFCYFMRHSVTLMLRHCTYLEEISSSTSPAVYQYRTSGVAKISVQLSCICTNPLGICRMFCDGNWVVCIISRAQYI